MLVPRRLYAFGAVAQRSFSPEQFRGRMKQALVAWNIRSIRRSKLFGPSSGCLVHDGFSTTIQIAEALPRNRPSSTPIARARANSSRNVIKIPKRHKVCGQDDGRDARGRAGGGAGERDPPNDGLRAARAKKTRAGEGLRHQRRSSAREVNYASHYQHHNRRATRCLRGLVRTWCS